MQRRISISARNSAVCVAILLAAIAGRLDAASGTAFDGYYTGTGVTSDTSTKISFSVIDGGVVWQAPGPSIGRVGQISAAGTMASLSASITDPNPNHAGASITFVGTLAESGNDVSGTGTFQDSFPCDPTGCGPRNGTFSVSRVSGPCAITSANLCVANGGDHPFDITVHYFTSQNNGVDADATAVSIECSGVTKGGAFAFSDPSNPEVLVKVLNGCATSLPAYWVFITAATNQGFNVVVRDTVTGAVVTYNNPDLHAATPVQDTAALPCS